VIRKDLIDGGVVRDARDLKGLTIGVAAAGLSAPEGLFLSGALGPVGLTVKDINVTELPFPDMIAALANRSIDGAIMVEPFVTRVMEMDAAVRWKGADELRLNQQTGVIIYSADFIATQPEAARRWMVAYLKGVREYMDAVSGPRNLDAIVPILTNHTTIKDPALYQKIFLAGFDVNGEVNVDSLNSAQDVWADNGFLESKLDARTIVDDQYLRFAWEQLGRR
jgi:NitT/TauT family transport system substrate-binding protein